MTIVQPEAPDRAGVEYAAHHGPIHWRPVYQGVAEGLCSLAWVMQGKARFELARSSLPMVLYLGDDPFGPCLGPDGFHRRSLRRAIERCSFGVIVACEPLPELYAAATTAAIRHGQNVVLVETRETQEIPWIEFLRECSPGISLRVGSVTGGTA